MHLVWLGAQRRFLFRYIGKMWCFLALRPTLCNANLFDHRMGLSETAVPIQIQHPRYLVLVTKTDEDDYLLDLVEFVHEQLRARQMRAD